MLKLLTPRVDDITQINGNEITLLDLLGTAPDVVAEAVENFIVAQTVPIFIGKVVNNGEQKTKEYPAIFKDGVLNVKKEAEPIAISYVKDGDYLLVGGHKFIRQK